MTAPSPARAACSATSGPDWHHLALQLNRTSADPKGDPDLFGAWTGGSRGVFVPSVSGKGFDFQDTSSSLHPTVLKRVDKSDFGADHDYEGEGGAGAGRGRGRRGGGGGHLSCFAVGAFIPCAVRSLALWLRPPAARPLPRCRPGALLCVRAYGGAATTFQLRASLDPCPSTFAHDGAPLMCHTRRGAPEGERRYEACSAAGECECRPPYARPVPEVYPGLGFEDCSAEVVSVNGSAFEGNASYVAPHQRAWPGRWRFFRFRMHEGDRQAVVTLAQEGGEGGVLDLYLKFGQPPSFGARQYDLRPAWNAASGDKALELSLDPSHPAYRTGDW